MELLTVEETAERLKVSADTIRELLKRNELPGVKVGRQWRISEPALRAYLNTRKTPVHKMRSRLRAVEFRPKALSSGLETAILSESVLAREWLTPEEDEYWAHLSGEM